MTRISEVMTPDPATCRVETPVQDVARMMIDNDCGQIPVLDDQGMPVGVITDRDIAVRIVARGGDGMVKASDAMSSPTRTVRTDSDLKEAVSLMEQAQVRRVPVVDPSGRLAGIVSLADIALAGKKKDTAEIVREVSEPRYPH